MDNHDPNSLDEFFQDHAKKSIPKHPHVGTLYKVSLPSNFAGMEASVVHLQSSSVWAEGADLGYFHVPSRIIAEPNVTWLDLVFSNLGNWSSYYYSMPDYTFVTPILGFSAYGVTYTKNQNGDFTSTTTKLKLALVRRPIMVQFPSLWLPKGKCAKFYSNGSTTITNMSLSRTCDAWDQGFFAVVVRGPPSHHHIWRWWVIGFGIGSIGLMLCGFVLFKVMRYFEMRKIQIMELQAEKNEVLDTTYVGHSRMPSAFGIRTQPVLENDYSP
ncbi:hypothetical protein LXL04_026662 [Taraxacum kok-saghyz]